MPDNQKIVFYGIIPNHSKGIQTSADSFKPMFECYLINQKQQEALGLLQILRKEGFFKIEVSLADPKKECLRDRQIIGDNGETYIAPDHTYDPPPTQYDPASDKFKPIGFGEPPNNFERLPKEMREEMQAIQNQGETITKKLHEDIHKSIEWQPEAVSFPEKMEEQGRKVQAHGLGYLDPKNNILTHHAPPNPDPKELAEWDEKHLTAEERERINGEQFGRKCPVCYTETDETICPHCGEETEINPQKIPMTMEDRIKYFSNHSGANISDFIEEDERTGEK